MNQAELIKQGQIQKRKQDQLQAVTAAKAALRSLGNAATYAVLKPVAEINTAEMTVYLEQLIAKQQEVKRIEDEIKELEY